jgi:hypothetical protein
MCGLDDQGQLAETRLPSRAPALWRELNCVGGVMMPPQLLIPATPVNRIQTARAVARNGTRDFRSTHFGDQRRNQYTIEKLGVVDPDQEGIRLGA